MPIEQPIMGFLRAWESLAGRCRHPVWGTVTGDARFPDVWDANRAMVFGGVTPSLAEVRAALADERARTGVDFEQVELVDVEAHAPLYGELTSFYGPAARFVLMLGDARRADPADANSLVDVDEAQAPDERSWLELKRTGHAGDGDDIPDQVLGQLIRRDISVFFRAGRRLFLARRDGEVAGMATLHSMESAALVDDVVTMPRHRRRGTASAVLRTIMEASRRNGDRALFLFTAEDGDARRMYQRLGFSVIAVSAQFHLVREPD